MSIYICNECNDAAFVALLNGKYRDYIVLDREEVTFLYNELLHAWIKTETTPVLRKLQVFLEKSNETKTNT